MCLYAYEHTPPHTHIGSCKEKNSRRMQSEDQQLPFTTKAKTAGSQGRIRADQFRQPLTVRTCSENKYNLSWAWQRISVIPPHGGWGQDLENPRLAWSTLYHQGYPDHYVMTRLENKNKNQNCLQRDGCVALWWRTCPAYSRPWVWSPSSP